MSFLYPNILWLLLLPLILGVLSLALHRQVGQAWRALVSPAHESELVHTRPIWRIALPTILVSAALASCIVAAARPILGYTETKSSASGRNLIIALDISRSMETNDVSPSRLEEARAAAYELIAALPSDRIGLIVFSGDADLVVPLTYDHAALRGTLEQIDRRWTASGGTNFGRLLEKAMQDFRRSAPNGTNALVILSDGEDTVDTPSDLAEQAKENKLLVITVGIGTTTGAAIPDPQGENGLWQDANGKHVISKLNEESLQQFAEATQGSYFAMSSGTDLAAFAKEAVSKLDRHEEQFSAAKVPNDIFEYFAGAALLLLVIAVLMNTDWRTPRFRVSLMFLLLILSALPNAHAAEDAATSYARALHMMQNNDADAAKEALSQALLSNKPALQAAALYSMGNINNEQTFDKLRALYQPISDDEAEAENATAPAQPGPDELKAIVGELNKNIQSYDDALSISPSMAPAANNKAKVQELIKKLEDEIKRLENQQNQQNQQDKQDQQNQQDQQDKQDQQNQQDQQDKQDQQNQQDQQDKQDQQDQQDQQDKQDQQNQQDQQDKQDQQNQQDQQDKQDQQNQQDQQDKQDQQNQQDQQAKQDQQNQQDQQAKQDQQNQQTEQGKQPQSKNQPQQAPPLSDEEKKRQRAASILKMHMDEEKGSPIPQFETTQPVLKDY